MSDATKNRGAYEPPQVEEYGQIHEITKMPPPEKVGGSVDSPMGGKPHPGQGSGVIG